MNILNPKDYDCSGEYEYDCLLNQESIINRLEKLSNTLDAFVGDNDNVADYAIAEIKRLQEIVNSNY